MAQEFLYFILGFGFIVLVIFFSYAAYQLGQTLKSLKNLVDEIGDVTRDFNVIKDKIRLGALKSLATILAMFFKKRR